MHRLNRHFKTEVLAPLVLDTPNQQDRGALIYSLVSQELKRRATKDTQLFVCASRHAVMQTLEKDSTVIELDENQLTNDFKPVSCVFSVSRRAGPRSNCRAPRQ
jgi:hypothetical protein